MSQEELEQKIPRAESQSSIRSKSSSVKWKEPVLSPTFHKVEIEQVKIIPSTSEVTFSDVPVKKPQSSGGRSSAGLQMVAPPPSEEGSMGTSNSDERHAFQESYLYSASKSRKIPERATKSREKQLDEFLEPPKWNEHPSNVTLVTLPLNSVGAVVSQERMVHTSHLHRSSVAEQKHRQKMAVIQHLQRLQANESPQQRRLISASKKTKQQYDETAPEVMLADDPSIDCPHTAPETGFGHYDDEIGDIYTDRAKTVPHISKSIIWTAKNRVNSSRAVSSISSTKLRMNELMDMQSNNKANMFIKLPFKQTPFVTMNTEKQFEDDFVRPGYELRLTTAFTVSRVRKAFKMMEHPGINNGTKSGRLLKGKLKPLCSVQMNGPTINDCKGIQPENQGKKKSSSSYTPSPSRQRQLKDCLNQAYENHRLKQAEYERRMIRAQSATSGESVHRTSPEPDRDRDISEERFVVNEQTGLTSDYLVENNMIKMENQLDSLHLESGVIY